MQSVKGKVLIIRDNNFDKKLIFVNEILKIILEHDLS